MDLENLYYAHCSVRDPGALMWLNLTELWQLSELLPIIRFHLDKQKYEQETSLSNKDSKVYQSIQQWCSISMNEKQLKLNMPQLNKS